MQDPVVAEDGHTYEVCNLIQMASVSSAALEPAMAVAGFALVALQARAIRRWLRIKERSPITGQPIGGSLYKNHFLSVLCQAGLQSNAFLGAARRYKA